MNCVQLARYDSSRHKVTSRKVVVAVSHFDGEESQSFDIVQEIYLVHLVHKAAKSILSVSDDQPFSVSLRYSDNSKEVTVKSLFTVPRE